MPRRVNEGPAAGVRADGVLKGVVTMGYIIGGIACVLYAVFVYYIAIKKPPALLRLVKMKFGKKTTDKTAVIVCCVMASLAAAGAVVLFIFAP